MSEEATQTTPSDPEETCSKTLEKLHPGLDKKLAAVKKREDAKELTNEEAGWEVMKLFVEADFNPFLPSNLALLETP